MTINWFAFVQVFIAALTGAVLVVGFYALGLRMLVRAGRAPVVVPADFTDAIAVITAQEARRAEKAAAKASGGSRSGRHTDASASPPPRCSRASCSSSSGTDTSPGRDVRPAIRGPPRASGPRHRVGA